jgi:succinylglutamate desuccinylase
MEIIQQDKSIETLTLEEIDIMLAQCESTLQQFSQEPLSQVQVAIEQIPPESMEEKFNKEWEELEKSLIEQYKTSIERDRDLFYYRNILEIILQQKVGEQITNEIFSTIRECTVERNFALARAFYVKHSDPEIQEMAKGVFYVYRFFRLSVTGEKFLGNSKNILKKIREITKNNNRLFTEVFNELSVLQYDVESGCYFV